MGFAAGKENYDEVKAQLQGNDFGLRCLNKLIKYESYIPYAAIKAHRQEVFGSGYLSSGDEEDTPHYEGECLQRSACRLNQDSEEVDALVFATDSDEQRAQFSKFARDFGLLIEHSMVLPFSILHIPSFSNANETEKVEDKLDRFIEAAGKYMRQTVIDALDAYHKEHETISQPHSSTFFQAAKEESSPSNISNSATSEDDTKSSGPAV